MSISFKQVQQNLEYYADELMALIGEDLDESRDYAESLRASLELHGACAFHELRAFHGDSRTFAYDTRVRNEMITELGRLLGALPVDPQSDGGQAAPTPREPEPHAHTPGRSHPTHPTPGGVSHRPSARVAVP